MRRRPVLNDNAVHRLVRSDNGQGNITWVDDIPDSEFEGFIPTRRSPWLWMASEDGARDGIAKLNLMDRAVQALRDIVGGAITFVLVLAFVVVIGAAVFTNVILPLMK